jgi:hypothetical protein
LSSEIKSGNSIGGPCFAFPITGLIAPLFPGGVNQLRRIQYSLSVGFITEGGDNKMDSIFQVLTTAPSQPQA